MRLGHMRESNPVVQEAIRVAMQRLSKHGKANVTKKHILKVLFLAKERLPDDNRVKHDLAYYWYMEGPYSEAVYANFDHMISSGLVLKTHATKTYRLAPERALKPISSSDDLEEPRREIGRAAKEFPNVHDAVKRAYEDAPFKWYDTYNLKFRPKFESHCKDVLAGRESRHSVQEMLGRLDDAVLDYPTIPEFMGHRMIFMDFAKMLNAFMRRDSYHTDKDMLTTLRGLCGSIWDAFAYGVRVHHHDPQYDDRVGEWTSMYKRKVDRLDGEILNRMEEFGDVGIDEAELPPEIVDMALHPERYEFTPLELDTALGNR